MVATGKENMLPTKKVRKALGPVWAAAQQMNTSDMSVAVETPVSIDIFCLYDNWNREKP